MRTYFKFLAGIVLAAAFAPALAATNDGAIHPGQIWPDDKGVHINAHGGGVLRFGDTYYWYGEHKVGGDAGNSAYVGIHVYSSKNLLAWKDEGIALAVSEDTTHDLSKGSIIERPKVIFNPKTRKFVMWFHLDFKGLGYKSSRSGVATSDSPLGPFTYLHSFLPNGGVWPLNIREEEKDPSRFPIARDHDGGQFARDMTLFVDDDGAAYHVYASEDNHTLHISRLSDDFTRPSGQYVRVLPGGDNEAPVMFKTRGKYYMITSGLSGWAPNAARSYVADTIFGPWTSLGNPVRGTQAQMDTTFGGQGTHIIPYKGGFIFMADIWRPKNAIDGRYAWLPLEWEDGKPVLRWQDSWRLDQVSGKSATSAITAYEPEMVAIPPGSFEMGSARGEPGREGDEAPRHTVRIRRGFYVSKYEITEAQWDACVADGACTPIRQRLGAGYPVTDIRWKEAQAYLKWLSAKSGKNYRFLTEAEWEYAARAGTNTAFATGPAIRPDQANYAASGFGKPRPVGQYAPNRFGLFDVHGNVWEWVADCHDERGYYEAPTDGSAVVRPDCQQHILRGGAFDTRPEQLRVAYRFNAQFGGEGVGLRVAMEKKQ